MLDWIPIQYYELIYYNTLLAFILITLFHTFKENNYNSSIVFNKIASSTLLVFVILFIGLRPINGIFADMTIYAKNFIKYAEGAVIKENDIGFQYFMKASTYIMNVETFFLVCSFLYVSPIYYSCKKWFAKYNYLAFLICVVSFSFWGYGTNGIRNGLATSFVILGMASRDRIALMVLLFAVAFLYHNSVALPIAAFLVAAKFKNTKAYLYLWLTCIPLSMMFGGYWTSLFAQIGFEEERMGAYLLGDVDDRFSLTGFRWDFIIYSASGVLAGYYYIFIKKINDVNYIQLYNTYITCNAFWILVIQASYSNRFAYLSWFMMGIVIIYPLLKFNILKKQYVKVGMLIAAYFSFTYIMFLLK